MAPDQDRSARGEHMMRPTTDITSPQRGGGPAQPAPRPEARAHVFETLATEISAPLPGPIALPALAEPGLWRPGSTLKHYEVIRKLGQGGMGSVFLARDTKLGRLVAVKVLLKHTGKNAARFLAEAQATAR